MKKDYLEQSEAVPEHGFSLYDYAQLWQQAFFTAMRMEYKLEETVAYANGAVDAMKDKFKENTND